MRENIIITICCIIIVLAGVRIGFIASEIKAENSRYKLGESTSMELKCSCERSN